MCIFYLILFLFLHHQLFPVLLALEACSASARSQYFDFPSWLACTVSVSFSFLGSFSMSGPLSQTRTISHLNLPTRPSPSLLAGKLLEQLPATLLLSLIMLELLLWLSPYHVLCLPSSWESIR